METEKPQFKNGTILEADHLNSLIQWIEHKSYQAIIALGSYGMIRPAWLGEPTNTWAIKDRSLILGNLWVLHPKGFVVTIASHQLGIGMTKYVYLYEGAIVQADEPASNRGYLLLGVIEKDFFRWEVPAISLNACQEVEANLVKVQNFIKSSHLKGGMHGMIANFPGTAPMTLVWAALATLADQLGVLVSSQYSSTPSAGQVILLAQKILAKLSPGEVKRLSAIKVANNWHISGNVPPGTHEFWIEKLQGVAPYLRADIIWDQIFEPLNLEISGQAGARRARCKVKSGASNFELVIPADDWQVASPEVAIY